MSVNESFEIAGQVVDLVHGRIFSGVVRVADGRIKSIEAKGHAPTRLILPGLVDAHIHIESSMLVPSEFARLALPHGTVAAVCDPHEIANVLGAPGVIFMIENGGSVPFKFCFGAPSCVPATPFETAGAELDAQAVRALLQRDDIYFLAEVMNFPGVLNQAPDLMAKIAAAKELGKVIDGHAPGLSGEALQTYIQAGISTDHESFSFEEGLEKIKLGMKVSIREGSAAKNFEALIPLLRDYPAMVMFCSDDKHPDQLLRGHINQHVKRAIAQGYEPLAVLRAASLNPIRHYGLKVGLLQPGDPADFIVVNDLAEFEVDSVFVDGRKVAEQGRSLIDPATVKTVNNFCLTAIDPKSLCVPPQGEILRVIEVMDGELLTKEIHSAAKILNGNVVSDPNRDILKLVVLNRYRSAPPAIGFVKNFGIKRGALASSVAHDSHNVIVIGCSDEEIAAAANLVISAGGGIALVDGATAQLLALPIAGLMSADSGDKVAGTYEELDRKAKALGSSLSAPFMTLSFLALPVIPELKLTDKGLFDVVQFEGVGLFAG